MTGRYPWKHGQHTNMNMNPAAGMECAVQKKLTFLPEYLSAAGYKNYMVGKWHLGYYSTVFTPTLRGFDEFVGVYSGGTNAINNSELEGNQEGIFRGPVFGSRVYELVNATKRRVGVAERSAILTAEYHDLLLADEAKRMIQNHDSRAPFFLYLAWFSPHNPIMAPAKYIGRNSKLENPCRKRFGGMLSAMDEALQKVISAVKRKRNAWGKTILIFASDNGGMAAKPPQQCVEKKAHSSIGNNYPLRGSKFNFWEGGIRTRAFIYSPSTSVIPKSVRGRTYTNLFSMTDWTTTILGFAGIKTGFLGLGTLDSIDHSQSIVRASSEVPRRRLDLQYLKGSKSWQNYVGFKYVNGALFKYMRGYPGEKRFLRRVTNRVELPTEGPKLQNPKGQQEYRSSACKSGCLFQIDIDEIEASNLLFSGNRTFSNVKKTWDKEISRLGRKSNRGPKVSKLCRGKFKLVKDPNFATKEAKARSRFCGFAVPWRAANFKKLPTKG